jgi:Zn-dependent protease with chaperone function
MGRKKLTGLSPWTYEHPRDRKTLDALEGTPGLETLVRKFNEWGLEHLARVEYTGSNLRATSHCFGELLDAVHQACETLDLPRIPEVYVTPGGGLNAQTVGVEHPILVIPADAIDKLSADELLFLVGRELGHIKSGHGLYLQVAACLPAIASMLEAATAGLGGLLATGLKYALLNWERTSQLTADRAGLLACQENGAAIATLAKLAGLPRKHYESFDCAEFIAQARAFEMLETDKVNRFFKAMSAMGRTHPWTVVRAQELLAWIDGGDYQTVLTARHDSGGPPRSLPDGPRFCASCGHALAGRPDYCTGCGTKVAAPPAAQKSP